MIQTGSVDLLARPWHGRQTTSLFLLIVWCCVFVLFCYCVALEIVPLRVYFNGDKNNWRVIKGVNFCPLHCATKLLINFVPICYCHVIGHRKCMRSLSIVLFFQFVWFYPLENETADFVTYLELDTPLFFSQQALKARACFLILVLTPSQETLAFKIFVLETALVHSSYAAFYFYKFLT